MTLKELSGFTAIEIIRDGSFSALGFLSDPHPGMLAFLEDSRLLEAVKRMPPLSCLLTTSELAKGLEQIPGLAISSNPRRTFFEVHNHLACNSDFYWADFPTEIDKTAKIHARAFVADKNIRIGPNTIIEANATVSERCIIGAGVIVRAGAVLGSVGFQTGMFDDCATDLIHAGSIKVCDRVEILSNAVIASAVFRQSTTIREDSKIGNLAFLSHNVQVGLRCFIGHGSIINGNVNLGSGVWIGPGSTLKNNICIGDHAHVSLGSTVIRDVLPGQRVTSNIAIDHQKLLRHIASLK